MENREQVELLLRIIPWLQVSKERNEAEHFRLTCQDGNILRDGLPGDEENPQRKLPRWAETYDWKARTWKPMWVRIRKRDATEEENESFEDRTVPFDGGSHERTVLFFHGNKMAEENYWAIGKYSNWEIGSKLAERVTHIVEVQLHYTKTLMGQNKSLLTKRTTQSPRHTATTLIGYQVVVAVSGGLCDSSCFVRLEQASLATFINITGIVGAGARLSDEWFWTKFGPVQSFEGGEDGPSPIEDADMILARSIASEPDQAPINPHAYHDPSQATWEDGITVSPTGKKTIVPESRIQAG